MFGKFVSGSVSSSSSSKSVSSLDVTVGFVRAVKIEGYRLSYASLTLVARELGEDSSKQKVGQRGSGLAKQLPKGLQWVICRGNGSYHEKALAAFGEVPSDLLDRQVIGQEGVIQALNAFLEAEKAYDEKVERETEEEGRAWEALIKEQK